MSQIPYLFFLLIFFSLYVKNSLYSKNYATENKQSMHEKKKELYNKINVLVKFELFNYLNNFEIPLCLFKYLISEIAIFYANMILQIIE